MIMKETWNGCFDRVDARVKRWRPIVPVKKVDCRSISKLFSPALQEKFGMRQLDVCGLLLRLFDQFTLATSCCSQDPVRHRSVRFPGEPDSFIHRRVRWRAKQ